VTAHELYRSEHPSSRAPGDWHWYGSTGCRRFYTCTYCGTVAATDAAKWRPTQRARAAVEAHVESCLVRRRYQRRAAVITARAARARYYPCADQ
jgi:hypothetical protein